MTLGAPFLIDFSGFTASLVEFPKLATRCYYSDTSVWGLL
ncbi:hypothetical protein P20495_0557 [Pseudoalteromonas sp. BSi20495]|nr:hypothetical protein P20495_0557 [Pseudoalteromonas sp. BSi20495]